MMRKLIVLTMVCVVPAIAAKSAGSAPEGVFNDGEVVLFIGDSITHGGRGGENEGSELIDTVKLIQ